MILFNYFFSNFSGNKLCFETLDNSKYSNINIFLLVLYPIKFDSPARSSLMCNLM